MRSGLRQLARSIPTWSGLAAVVLGAGLLTASPVLHEYFETTPDMLGLGGRPPSFAAGFPPSIATPSGSASAPELNRPNTTPSYAQAAARESSYGLDGNTSRPELVGYSDPFTPTIPPFKRSYAYDSVDGNLRLVVADPKRTGLPIRGKARLSDDQFYADINLTLAPGQAVRIPSVGPGARVLAARLTPDVPFDLTRDSADNWFVTTETRGDFRLMMHLAIDRRTFGAGFLDVSWEALAPHLPDLPTGIHATTEPVLEAMGLTREVRPAYALRRLVEHFRSFAPAQELSEEQGVDLYRQLALAKKGVCRHRSFAFAVTALSLGLPTRFVRNEAHAWVEVFDSELWHRVDLGGAAGRLDMAQTSGPPHAPPSDPFQWPQGSDSGTQMAARSLTPNDPAGSAGQTAGANTSSGQTPEAPVTMPRLAPGAPREITQEMSERPPPTVAPIEPLVSESQPSVVSVKTREKQATRGTRTHVEGIVRRAGGVCELTRVDIQLQSDGGQWHLLGTLVTDNQGHYQGEVVIPPTVPVGDYELFAATPGSPACTPGSSLD
ncbi:MAG: hypothetical protein RJA70_325 [Pseudomonadota bacterium]|jgi:hypothetical protein